MPHGMCYSHFANEVCNGSISIMQRGFINDCNKVNPVGQWGKILVMAMGFVDHLGLCLFMVHSTSLCYAYIPFTYLLITRITYVPKKLFDS